MLKNRKMSLRKYEVTYTCTTGDTRSFEVHARSDASAMNKIIDRLLQSGLEALKGAAVAKLNAMKIEVSGLLLEGDSIEIKRVRE